MKKSFKKILASLLVAVMIISAAPMSGFVGLDLNFDWLDLLARSLAAEDENIITEKINNNFSWSLNKSDKTLTIDCTGSMVTFEYENAPWHSYSSYVENVIINDGCKNISSKAFWYCTKLKSIDIPNSVVSIDNYAFYGCSSLINIDLPNGLTCINDYSFAYCSSLVSIKIPNEVQSIRYGAFVSDSSLSEVILGKNLYSIEYAAFENCTSLTSITIPESTNNISPVAFKGCTNLKDVSLPYNISSIQEGTFAGCKNIGTVTIYNKNCSISEGAFTYYATLAGFTGSTTESYCENYGYPFIAIDDTHEHTYSNACDETCNLCGEHRIVPDHDFGEWTIVTEPTHDTTGLRKRVCLICGYTESEVIPLIPYTGDVACDGIINSSDALYVLQYDVELIEFTEQQLNVADVNNDGKINSYDAMLILQYTVGEISSFDGQ